MCRGWGTKINDFVIFLHRLKYKTMQTFDMMSNKFIVSVQINSMSLCHGIILTTRAKVRIIQQSYNLIDEVNLTTEGAAIQANKLL